MTDSIITERGPLRCYNYEDWRKRKHQLTYTIMGLSIVTFLVGALLTGMGLYEYPGEATLLTFARLPPAEGETVQEILKQSTVLKYRKVGMTTLGFIAFIKGGVGFGVSLKHPLRLLVIYATGLSAVVLGQMIVITFGFAYHVKIQLNLEMLLNMTLIEAYDGAIVTHDNRIIESDDEFSIAWDFVMARARCCGIHSYYDFANFTTRWNRGVLYHGSTTWSHVPYLCCKMINPLHYPYEPSKVQFINIGKCMKSGMVPYINTTPCYDWISSVIRNSTTIHLTVALVSTLLDVASVVTALVLFHIIRTRLLRRQAYRTLKSKLFTMITDLSTSIMLFVSPAPPPPQPAESSSDDVNLGKHKPQKQRRRSTQSSP